MKITYIAADTDDDTGLTKVSLGISSALSPAEAISSVLALFAGAKSYDEDNAAREAMQAKRQAEYDAAAAMQRHNPASAAAVARGEQGIGGTGAGSPNWSDAEVASMRNISREGSDAKLQAGIAATRSAGERIIASAKQAREMVADAAAKSEITGYEGSPDKGFRYVTGVADPATEPKAEKVTRTRRPRTNPDAAPVASDTSTEVVNETTATVVDAPVEGRRRTRVTQETPAETVKTITDADLAKACSNAAAIIGIEVVQAVIADFAVKSMQELAPDVREKFLGELEDEIRLAKEELAKAGK